MSLRPTVPLAFPPPLTSEDFELLCLQVFRVAWDAPDLQRLGRRGHGQHGCDLYGADGQQRVCGIQCKHRDFHRELSEAEVEEEFQKAEGLCLHRFAIATTGKRKPALQIWAAAKTETRKASGLGPVQVFSWDDINELLNIHLGLASSIYLGDASAAKSLPSFYSPVDFFRPWEDRKRLFHHNWQLVGREQQLNEFRRFLASGDKRAALLIGRGGIGKTALVRAFCRIAETEDTSRLVLICASDGDLSRILQFRFWQHRYLIIVDDAHRASGVPLLANAV